MKLYHFSQRIITKMFQKQCSNKVILKIVLTKACGNKAAWKNTWSLPVYVKKL